MLPAPTMKRKNALILSASSTETLVSIIENICFYFSTYLALQHVICIEALWQKSIWKTIFNISLFVYNLIKIYLKHFVYLNNWQVIKTNAKVLFSLLQNIKTQFYFNITALKNKKINEINFKYNYYLYNLLEKKNSIQKS